jgi:hypothetical protein
MRKKECGKNGSKGELIETPGADLIKPNSAGVAG